MAKKCLSEGRMWQLWRQVVLINSHNHCQICGRYFDNSGLEAHHIIRRVKKITRWLPKNGAALCHECHRKLHNQNKVKREFEASWKYIDELDELNLMTYPDFLQSKGLCHFKYYGILAEDMKKIIKESL